MGKTSLHNILEDKPEPSYFAKQMCESNFEMRFLQQNVIQFKWTNAKGRCVYKVIRRKQMNKNKSLDLSF